MSDRSQVGWPRSNGRDLILILARHYIAAAAADGEGWMNLKVQADAAKEDAAMSPVVEAAPAKPPTVADLLRVLPVVEWRDRNGHWHQSRADKTRYWSRELVRWTGWVIVVLMPLFVLLDTLLRMSWTKGLITLFGELEVGGKFELQRALERTREVVVAAEE